MTVDNARERVVPLASIPADASAHICSIRLTVHSLNGTQHETAYRIIRMKLFFLKECLFVYHQFHVGGTDTAPASIVRINQLPYLLWRNLPITCAATFLGDDVSVHVIPPPHLVLYDVINDVRCQQLKHY